MTKKLLNSSFLFLFILLSCGEGASNEVDKSKQKKKLPFIGDHEVVQNEDGQMDTLYHTIPDFIYLDQDSNIVKSSDFEGKIIIADFFFTNCSSICKPMTTQMKRLNENLSDLKNEIQFLSFSIDPNRDSPSQLRKYIQDRGLNTDNWKLLTGDEDATHELGCEGFKVHAARDENDDDGYAHSEYFVLVDRDGHIRGLYAGTSPDDVNNMESDARFLLKSEYGIDGKK